MSQKLPLSQSRQSVQQVLTGNTASLIGYAPSARSTELRDDVSAWPLLEFYVSVRRHVQVQLADMEVKQILSKASSVLNESLKARDIPCRVKIHKKGKVGVFTDSEVPLHIDGAKDFEKVGSAIGSIKVVYEIRWCGYYNQFFGCASQPGKSLVVRRVDVSEIPVGMDLVTAEGILWAHELGHTTGLGHDSEPFNFMYPVIDGKQVEALKAQCQAMRSGSPVYLGSPSGSGAKRTGRPAPAQQAQNSARARTKRPVEQFVRGIWIEGIPIEQALQYDANDASILRSMLANSENRPHWRNIVYTLGLIGKPGTAETLMSFLTTRGTGRLSRAEYEAKIAVPVALGFLHHRSVNR